MPAITRLTYFDVTLQVLSSGQFSTVEAVRQAIGRHVEDLALLGEARLTKPPSHPYSFRNTTVDVLRQLMRWGWVEQLPLADAEASFDEVRSRELTLTPAGIEAARWSDGKRRDAIGVLAFQDNRFFHDLLVWLQTRELAIPEFSDSQVRTTLPNSWPASPDEIRELARLAHATYASAAQGCIAQYARRLPDGPEVDFIAGAVHTFLNKRFTKRQPKTHKELVGAASDGLAKAYLTHFGINGDANGLERALAWARDLFLIGSGRAVLGVPVWLTWSAAEIRKMDDAVQFDRRRASEHRQEVEHAILCAYAAAAKPSQGQGMTAPLVPIYIVRETAAYAARVCEPVVDRVLTEMFLEQGRSQIVQLQLGDLRAFPPSAKPFRIGEARYYYMTVHGRVQE